MKLETKKFLAVVIIAILLGMVSPFLAAIDDGPVLTTWFQWLPIHVDLLVLPDGYGAMLALAMLVLSAQYLLVFLSVMSMRQMAHRLLRFIAAPLRRAPVAR